MDLFPSAFSNRSFRSGSVVEWLFDEPFDAVLFAERSRIIDAFPSQPQERIGAAASGLGGCRGLEKFLSASISCICQAIV
jgi:hypothetical protein